MKTAQLSPLTPLSFLKRSVEVFPDKTAVIYGDKRATYAQLGERVGRLAAALVRAGVNPGDRVAFVCPNTPAMLEAHFGVMLAGAVLVSINIRLAPREIAYILNHSGSKIVVVDSEFSRIIEEIQGEIPSVQCVVTVVDAGFPKTLEGPEYEDFLTGTGAEPVVPLPIDDDIEDELGVICINYTSGTTGQPKGVLYQHRAAYLNATSEIVTAGLTSDSVYLWTLPMFHCNGWCFPWAVTAVGGTHLCIRKIDPAEVYDLIEREGVSHFCAAPTVLIALSSHPSAQGRKFPLRPGGGPVRILTAAAPPSPHIIRTIQEMGAEITHVYGLTEVYGPFTVCEWRTEWNSQEAPVRARLKARQGVAMLGCGELRVVDEQMNEVRRDGETLGEVLMRGHSVMAGYFNDPEATAKAFAGGWFHTGDVAVWHPDGYIELRDRKKDIIISGGENISTVEVERAIYEHPDVLEVAVIGIPDPKWGEVPKAFVVPRPGANPTAEDIVKFCRERLAAFKCPKAVEFGELPKTSTGKIQKFVLRQREWQGREKLIN